LLALVPDNYDCLANLGVAYLQSGDMELSAKCFQDLVLKDHNHPAALINYAAELLCKHSSTVAGLFLIKEPLNCLLLSICLSKVHMKKVEGNLSYVNCIFTCNM
jgi:tetratricopeptide (TPR) repeat protein